MPLLIKIDRNHSFLCAKFVKFLECDSARISEAGNKLFLIVGHKKHTKDGAGQWYANGEPVDWEYLDEKVVASGQTLAKLIESATEYKRLKSVKMEDYFAELISEKHV